VFVSPLPANAVELRTRITAAVAEVTSELPRGVWQETDYRWASAALPVLFFFFENPIYLQSVVVHSANGW
jgi:hypothetical protein